MFGGDWWVLGVWNESPAALVSWVFWVIASITLHELGHGWSAIRAGDTTPIDSGHMTWNPIVHMGVMSLLIFALIGLAWGAMPIDPSRFKGRHADLRVSAAGPAMNVGIAVVLMIALPLWGALASPFVGELAFENVATFLLLGAMLNVALVLLNLLPIPPLDGSRMLASLSPAYRSMVEGPNSTVVGLFLLLAVFVFGIDLIFIAATTTVSTVNDSILGLLGG